MDLEGLVRNHALDPAAATYARLGVLQPGAALEFERERGARLLRDPDASTVPLIQDGSLVALGIARARPADGEALGKRVGEVVWLSVDSSLEPAVRRRFRAELLDECRLKWRDSFDLVTFLVDADLAEELEALQVHRARIYGANATWVGATSRIASELLDHPMVDRAGLWEGPSEALLECVAASYGGYRSHYHADSRLSVESASASYVAAVRRHLEAGGLTAAVERDGRVEGFSTINLHDELNEHLLSDLVGEIEISGTTPEARTPGVYEMTVRRALRWYRDRGVGHVVFSCKADNFTVQHVWVRLGAFRPCRFRYRFHWWLDS